MKLRLPIALSAALSLAASPAFSAGNDDHSGEIKETIVWQGATITKDLLAIGEGGHVNATDGTTINAGEVTFAKGTSLLVDQSELTSTTDANKKWFTVTQGSSFTLQGDKALWTHSYQSGMNEGSSFTMKDGATANVGYLAFGGTANLSGTTGHRTVLNLGIGQNLQSAFGGNQQDKTIMHIDEYATVNATKGLSIGHRSDAATSKDATVNVKTNGELKVAGTLDIGAGRTNNSDKSSGNGTLNIAGTVTADTLNVGTGENKFTGQTATGTITIAEGGLLATTSGVTTFGAGATVNNAGSLSTVNSLYLQKGAALNVTGKNASWVHGPDAYMNEGASFNVTEGAKANINYLAFGAVANVTGLQDQRATLEINDKAVLGGHQQDKTTLNINEYGTVIAKAMTIGHRSDATTSKDATVNVKANGELKVAGTLDIGAGHNDGTAGNGTLNIAGTVTADSLNVGTGENKFTGQTATGTITIDQGGSLGIAKNVTFGSGANATIKGGSLEAGQTVTLSSGSSLIADQTSVVKAADVVVHDNATLVTGTITGSGTATKTSETVFNPGVELGEGGSIKHEGSGSATFGSTLVGSDKWSLSHEEALSLTKESWENRYVTTGSNYLYSTGANVCISEAKLKENENVIVGGGELSVAELGKGSSVIVGSGTADVSQIAQSQDSPLVIGSINDQSAGTAAQIKMDTADAGESKIVASNLKAAEGERTVINASTVIQSNSLEVSCAGEGKTTLVNNGVVNAAVTVNSNATLAGSGTFQSTVTVNGSGATLVIGNSPGKAVYEAGLTINGTGTDMAKGVFAIDGLKAATGSDGWGSGTYSNAYISGGDFNWGADTVLVLELGSGLKDALVSGNLLAGSHVTFDLMTFAPEVKSITFAGHEYTNTPGEVEVTGLNFVFANGTAEGAPDITLDNSLLIPESVQFHLVDKDGTRVLQMNATVSIPEPGVAALGMASLAGLFLRRKRTTA